MSTSSPRCCPLSVLRPNRIHTGHLVVASSCDSMMGLSLHERILSLIYIEELANGETGHLGTPGIMS